MPTSITVAPGWIKSRVTKAGSHGCHQDIGFARHGGQIARARVANRHRGVFVEQEHGHRLPHDVAAAITTARAPLMGIFERLSICRIAAGVHKRQKTTRDDRLVGHGHHVAAVPLISLDDEAPGRAPSFVKHSSPAPPHVLSGTTRRLEHLGQRRWTS